jgi:hypothetical protein
VENQERRTTRAVIFGGLLVASTLLYTNGDTALALIGYLASAASFISVVFGNGD